MKWNWYQKLALLSLFTLLVLIFMGGIVRATGSGLGCPDWPKCWGCYIPPTSVDEIDPKTLDLEKYKRKLAEYGGDADKLDSVTVLDYFDPVKTWIEYINRLLTTPLSIATIAFLIYAQFLDKKRRWDKVLCAYLSLGIVIVNAVMGFYVVKSGLQPGIITVHMALAVIMVCVLVYAFVKGGNDVVRLNCRKSITALRLVGYVLFILIVLEGIMGSQVRELTDELQRTHSSVQRVEWTQELENSLVYLLHRSFSWLILTSGVIFLWMNFKWVKHGLSRDVLLVFGVILAQMVMGLVLAWIGVLPVIQVLHIGLSSILVAAMFHWLMRKPVLLKGD